MQPESVSKSPDVHGRLFFNCTGKPANSQQEIDEHFAECSPCGAWIKRRDERGQEIRFYSAEVLQEWRDGGCDKDGWLSK